MEKRERRAMERKLSEMEEELKVGVWCCYLNFVPEKISDSCYISYLQRSKH